MKRVQYVIHTSSVLSCYHRLRLVMHDLMLWQTTASSVSELIDMVAPVSEEMKERIDARRRR